MRGDRRQQESMFSYVSPEARSYRKGNAHPAILCYQSHLLMENRNGLIVDHELTQASGTAERDAAAAMVSRLAGRHRVGVGADKGYDTAELVAHLRCLEAIPHVAQNTRNRRSAIYRRTTRHPGYTVSQRVRKRIEEIFGWGTMVGPLRQVKLRGVKKVIHLCLLTYAAHNLVRMRNLAGAVP
ncbi:transposase [Thioalkalivibrio denitrificans]|uniref:Transposase n=1 Tax=Thioalkalivibrio denitrificans TaxID=108003 RepID=A0A1V3NH09_9GAMM|nr:transposase [Thioalkalivibrio denitrificans]OOG24335.1 transposase [Thioalkalivibrio denitrificans]